MRILRGLGASLAAASLASLLGCSGAAAGSPGAEPSPSRHLPNAASAALTGAAERTMQAGARAAAAKFDAAYLGGRFAAAWALLTPAAKRDVSERVWVDVHNACHPGSAGKARVITSITVFGNAAIVIEVLPAMAISAEHVFNDVDGQWGLSPDDLSIYHLKSVSADIGAARASGMCHSWKGF